MWRQNRPADERGIDRSRQSEARTLIVKGRRRRLADANFPDLDGPNHHGAIGRAAFLRRHGYCQEYARPEQSHQRGDAHGTLLLLVRCVIGSEHREMDNAG